MPNYINEIFSARLKEAIRDWGLRETEKPDTTIKDFAYAMDIPENTIYNYTSGNYLPSCSSLYMLCTDLDVSADWLLGLTDVKERKNYSPYSE